MPTYSNGHYGHIYKSGMPPPHMQDKFEKVLSGELKVEELSDEERVEFHREIKQSSEEELKKYQGVKQARQAEEQKLSDAQKEAERKEEEAQNKKKEAEGAPSEDKPKDERFDQFRNEQVEKAKEKLFSTINVSDADRKSIEEKFQRLDSGKLDSDLIYKDLLSAVAAAKPEEYLNALKEKQEMEQNASEYERGQAGGSADANPSGDTQKKFSDEVMALSKEAGITPEQAQKQISDGMRRVYE